MQELIPIALTSFAIISPSITLLSFVPYKAATYAAAAPLSPSLLPFHAPFPLEELGRGGEGGEGAMSHREGRERGAGQEGMGGIGGERAAGLRSAQAIANTG